MIVPMSFTLVIDHAPPLLAARLLAAGAVDRLAECDSHPGMYNLAAECATVRDLTELVFKLRDVGMSDTPPPPPEQRAGGL